MPNWCENDLTLVGDTAEDTRKFVADMKKKQEETGREMISAEYFIPYPAVFREQDEKVRKMRDEGVAWKDLPKDGFNSGGYEWCIANWGTKWDFTRPEVRERYTHDEPDRWYGYSFDTAWSPPRPVILAMSIAYPNITFALEWYEQGMAARGTYKAKAGVVLENTQSEYHGDRGG